METPKTPELDKLSKCREKSQAIGEFLDWLSEQDILLASCHAGIDLDETLLPIRKSINTLLHEYFGIDEKKCEKERQMLLEALRKTNT